MDMLVFGTKILASKTASPELLELLKRRINEIT